MTGIDHIGISVADLEGMTDWYRRALDLDVRQTGEIPGTGIRVVLLADADGTWAIELLHRPDSMRSHRITDPDEALLAQGYGHLCLRVADIDLAHRDLVAAGAASLVIPRDARRQGARLAYVADPEGNLIELIDRGIPT